MPWIVPWFVVAPACSFLMVVSAVLAWWIGRWSLRRSFRRDAYENAIVANQALIADEQLCRAERLEHENKELRGALRGITSLATRVVIDTQQVSEDRR